MHLGDDTIPWMISYSTNKRFLLRSFARLITVVESIWVSWMLKPAFRDPWPQLYSAPELSKMVWSKFQRECGCLIDPAEANWGSLELAGGTVFSPIESRTRCLRTRQACPPTPWTQSILSSLLSPSFPPFIHIFAVVHMPMPQKFHSILRCIFCGRRRARIKKRDDGRGPF